MISSILSSNSMTENWHVCAKRVEWPSQRKNKLITKEKLVHPIFQTILRKYKIKKKNRLEKREVTHSALSIVVCSTKTEMDLMGIYWTLLPPTMAENLLFSSAHEVLSKVDLILSHKTYVGNFEGIEIIWSMLVYLNGILFEINSSRIFVKFKTTWQLNHNKLNND